MEFRNIKAPMLPGSERPRPIKKIDRNTHCSCGESYDTYVNSNKGKSGLWGPVCSKCGETIPWFG